jgi:hypothetical protein
MSYVEDDILFHVYLHRRLRSDDIIDNDKDQSVKV